MDPCTQLDDILPRLNELVASLSDAQLDAPTACSKFAVRDILEHMIDGATMFAGACRGVAPLDRSGKTDVVATFPVAMADLQQAVHSPGALERTIAAPFGDVPGDAFAPLRRPGRPRARMGHRHRHRPALRAARGARGGVDAFTRQAISEAMRDDDTFAAPVDAPAGASPLIQLVAFTGRHVALD